MNEGEKLVKRLKAQGTSKVQGASDKDHLYGCFD
jgi:hypothetical protein